MLRRIMVSKKTGLFFMTASSKWQRNILDKKCFSILFCFCFVRFSFFKLQRNPMTEETFPLNVNLLEILTRTRTKFAI